MRSTTSRFSDLKIRLEVGPRQLKIDGRGKAEVKNLAHDVRGLKVKFHSGKRRGSFRRSSRI